MLNADVLNRNDLINENLTGEMENKFLTFPLGEEEFGIEIMYVKQIVGVQPITSIPEAPGYIPGVVNLRGRVLPVIDLRQRLGISRKELDERTCFIITTVEDNDVGLIVDEVSEVLEILPEDVQPASELLSTDTISKCLKGLGKVNGKVKILMDLHKLLFEVDDDFISSKVKPIEEKILF